MEAGLKSANIVICMLHLVVLLVIILQFLFVCFKFELLLRAEQCFGSLLASGEQRTVGSV